MKKCSKCPRRGPFTKNRAKKDGLNHLCVVCQREYNRAHYKANKKYYVKKARIWNDKAIAEVAVFLSWLKDQPCWDCGLKFPLVCMDFDHVRGKKKFNISEWFRHVWVFMAIWKEVLKCDLVCSNCHRVRTDTRRAA